VAHPVLEPLTDVFALPAWVPLANVFSVGDVLIGAGIALVIANRMRRPAPARLSSPTGAELRDRG
jgi:multisubunit Na+/H+ antiporter MnhE subunit